MLPNDVVSNVPDITSTDLTKQDMGLCGLMTQTTDTSPNRFCTVCAALRKYRIACSWLSE